MNKNRKWLWIIALILSIAILAGGTVYLWMYFNPTGDKELRRGDFAKETEAATEEETATEAATEPETEAKPVEAFGYQLDRLPDDWDQLDFEALHKINTDIYGWIYIPDTNVDYPVAQHMKGNDSYYLDHNIYGNYQFSGTIYSQSMNRPGFVDPVTVLYGHNMLNGSMFATLHKFEDKKFFEKHTTMFVFTEDKLLTYLIYAAYTYDDRHILNTFHMYVEESLKSYQQSTLNPYTYNGNVRKGIKLDKDSRILTLSTCSNGSSDTRYLVQGVLVDVKEYE